jgi:oligopeptide transport system permease protein
MNPSAPGTRVSESPWQAAFRRLRGNHLAVAGALFMVILTLACWLLPQFSSYQQSQQDLNLQASPPSPAHWMGTDSLGRDIATRVLYGGRMSLLVGLAATGVALVIGVIYGGVSGWIGGRTDAFLMRVVDVLYAFPFIVFVILLNVAVGEIVKSWLATQSWLTVAQANQWRSQAELLILFAAIGAVEWLTMARVVRGQVLALKKLEFITAARSYGARTPMILRRHLLPNVLGSVIIYASLTVPGVMLLEATLSFLGLGIQPPAASWGTLIADGAKEIESSPWLLLFPGAFFSCTLLALNFLGDGLRDALDPKSVQ